MIIVRMAVLAECTKQKHSHNLCTFVNMHKAFGNVYSFVRAIAVNSKTMARDHILSLYDLTLIHCYITKNSFH